jgi:hypothetical protein
MADLEPRVKQVEEDVAILKGEIKSILIEVRTSLLSQTNPFTSAPLAPPPIVPQAPAPAAPFAPNPSGPFAPSTAGPAGPQAHEPAHQPEPPTPFLQEGSNSHDRPQQSENWTNNVTHFPQPAIPRSGFQPAEPQLAPQQPVPLPVAPRRSWELNTLAMLLAWCQGNMVRLSEKEMTSLLSLARYGGLVDEELAGILLQISNSFDDGNTGRAATVSEYLLALHELHTVIKEEEDPAIPRLRRAG